MPYQLSSNDQQFYNQRAEETKAAVDRGDIEAAADLVGHAIAEGGLEALEHLTDAVERNKHR
jgi:hypothetical protein